MKGLLIKDMLTIGKQMKIFILLIVVFACLPGYNMAAFAVMYSAMLPVTALAYDERAKWNNLAAMMPYTPIQLVMSKYIIGYIAMLASALLSAAAQFVVAMVKGAAPLATEGLLSLVIVLCLASLMQSVSLPFMFRLGVEKGRLALWAIVALFVIVGTVGDEALSSALAASGAAITSAIPLLLIATVVISALSIALSAQAYSKRVL